MAATDGWIEQSTRPVGKARMRPRKSSRSLGAALRDAGLDGAAPDPRNGESETFEAALPDETDAEAPKPIAEYRSPSLSLFTEAHLKSIRLKDTGSRPSATVAPAHHESVVSPPPWLRAARRGRRRQRLLNTFGWAMTLAITGAIVGIAGHFLAISPTAIVTSMQARP